MITSASPLLRKRDHAILTGIATQGGLGSSAYFRQLQDKLQKASVIELDDVEPDLATLGSLVRYRVNGGRALEHTLSFNPQREQEQNALSIKTLRGLALLGMVEGKICSVHSFDPDKLEALELEMVLFQPEADGSCVRRDYERHGT